MPFKNQQDIGSNLKYKSIAAIFATALLAGCSAFDDDDNDSNNNTTNTSLSGKVADGYLKGAKVCLDLNSNKVCDDGEPSTTSTEGGAFELAGVTQAQLDSAPLLVEVVVGETVDEDNPNETIDKKYTLTAPAGYAFISPLTTMVQSEIEDNGVSPEEAKGAIQAKLGTTLDLEADYVAGSDGGDDAAEFERLHKVAQVTVVVMQNNIETVEQILSGAEVSFEDLLGIIVSQVLDALDDISTQVDAVGGSFDPDAVADSDALGDANVNPATVEEDIAEREADRNSEAVSIASILAGGESIHFFEGRNDNGTLKYSYGTVGLTGNTSVSITKTNYNPNTDDWEAEAAEGARTDQICVLNNSQWQCVDEDNESISVEGDAIIVKIDDIEATRSEITGVSINLADKRIATFLDDDFEKVVDLRADFTNAVNGYKLSFKRTQEMYAIFKDNVPNAADCFDGQGGTGAWAPTDVWCNNVHIVTGDGNHANDGDAATSFDQLISATAASNPSSREDIKGAPIYGRDFEVMAEFVQGGVANYYIIHNEEGQPSTLGDKVSGTWEQVTVDGKALMRFALPGLLIELGGLRNDERLQFFTVEDSYVRRGGVEPVGERGDGNDWVFNNAGRDQIRAAFNYALRVDYTACTDGDVEYDEDNTAEKPGATYVNFDSAADDCSAIDFSPTELVDKTLVTDFGFLTFKAAGEGTFFGEVGDNDNAVLDFTWAVNSDNYIVVNTQATENGTTTFLRLTLAKITSDVRQIHVKSFSQEGASTSALDDANAKGSIEGEVWGLN